MPASPPNQCKNGKVIKAIRALAHVVAIRQGKRFRINLADETGAATQIDTAPETEAETESEEVADVIDLSETKAAILIKYSSQFGLIFLLLFIIYI
jgi:hypothetical protein